MRAQCIPVRESLEQCVCAPTQPRKASPAPRSACGDECNGASEQSRAAFGDVLDPILEDGTSKVEHGGDDKDCDEGDHNC
jgi:hypothetical protein